MRKMHKSEYTSLIKRLDYLKRIRRAEVADELRFAVELGDLRENSEYDAAVEEYQWMEREIYLLEKEIENVCVIEKNGNNVVEVGSNVILDFDGEEECYTIVASSFLNFDNTISLSSILGSSILNHRVGDKVLINSPGGDYFVTIKDIK